MQVKFLRETRTPKIRKMYLHNWTRQEPFCVSFDVWVAILHSPQLKRSENSPYGSDGSRREKRWILLSFLWRVQPTNIWAIHRFIWKGSRLVQNGETIEGYYYPGWSKRNINFWLQMDILRNTHFPKATSFVTNAVNFSFWSLSCHGIKHANFRSFL